MRKKIYAEVGRDLTRWVSLSFSHDKLPKLSCPTCHKGELLFNKDRFHYSETRDSEKSHSDKAFEINWVEYNFVALFQCSDNSCKEIVSVIGTGGINEYRYYDEQANVDVAGREDEFYPLYFNPPLNLFDIPSESPSEIKDEITKSFALFFADKSASANRIRSTVELILNDKKVKNVKVETGLGGKKTRRNLSLHKRILEFGKKESEIAEHLLAIKWIGNPASHAEKINKMDLLDAFEILKYCLGKLYDDSEGRVRRITMEINKRRKPRSARSKPTF